MSKQKQNSELNAKLNKIESHEISILAKNDGLNRKHLQQRSVFKTKKEHQIFDKNVAKSC